MRRPLIALLTGIFAVSLMTSAHLTASAVAAATIAPTTTCSNGVDDTPGLGLICQVAIANTITPSGGTAHVTIRECHGAAGDPTAACTVQTHDLTSPVSQVTQCNASTNGGGGTLRCSVDITNRFVGVTSNQSAVTVNQCDGSGDGVANTCDPFPATTSGATVNQCNGSANGGTLVGLTCTATGMAASGFTVEVDQCNGSTNGGGALVICSVAMRNTFTAGTPTPTSTAGGGGSGGGSGTEARRATPTGPPSDVAAPIGAATLAPSPVAFLALTLVMGLALWAVARRRSTAR